MFANKPNPLTNALEDTANYWKDLTSPFIDELKELRNSRLIYDGCNAGVRIGNGGLVRLYRNKYCQPPPVPKSEEQQLRKMDLSSCGGISFRAIYSTKNLGFYYDPVLNSFRPRLLASSLDEIFNLFLTKYPDYRHNKYAFFESAGGTGSNPNKDLGNGISYRTYQQIGNGCGPDGDPYSYRLSYPSYYASGGNIEVTGSTSIIAINAILDDLSSGGFTPEIDRINVFNPGATGCPSRKPTPDPPPPPPPPPEKECDCMDCCCPQNDTLMKLILKRIGEPQKVTIFDEDMEREGAQKAEKTPESLNDYLKLAVERIEIINRLVGIENFPIEVPDTMIEPHKEGIFGKIFKFIDGEKKIKITTIAEFIVWMSKQDSAVLGEFHQVIEVETEVKGKNATIVLPNVAESLKEIVLLTAQMAKQNNIQTELIFKIAAELVATRAVATKGTTISQDIQDYLDYPTNTKKAKIKTAISLPKFQTNKKGIPIATAQSESSKDFLKPGEIEYVYDDWTGSNSLHDQLLDLLQLAAMLRAIYYQRTDKEQATIE